MKQEIILSEADIQSIINGRSVNKTFSDGTKVSIRQSYVRDMLAPVINDRFSVTDTLISKNDNTQSNTFKLGS